MNCDFTTVVSGSMSRAVRSTRHQFRRPRQKRPQRRSAIPRRATDLLGLLIARIEGEPLGAVLKRRIFEPLGMKDTSFLVSRDKRDRRAAAYGFNDEERLIKRTTWGCCPRIWIRRPASSGETFRRLTRM